jgi:hypothetical protein
MRLEIAIDGVSHYIDSVNPELLGPWMVEIFARVTEPSPATYYQVRAWPSYIPGKGPDWITTGTQIVNVRTPRELVRELTAELDRIERT